MDPATEERYIQMALDNPTMLGSEVPLEVLKAASLSGNEPTRFVREFLKAGHVQWLLGKYGDGMPYAEDQLGSAVLLLWIKACYLHTSHLLSRPNPDWDRSFFSDEHLRG